MTKTTSYLFTLFSSFFLWVCPWNLHAENVQTAKSVWKKEMGVSAKAIVFDDLPVFDDTGKEIARKRQVYFGDEKGCIYCFEEQSNGSLSDKPIWIWALDNKQGDEQDESLIDKTCEIVGIAVDQFHRIYFSLTDKTENQGTLYCLDPQGKEKWKISLDKQIWKVVCNQQDRLYLVANDCKDKAGWVFCYNYGEDRIYEKKVGAPVWGLKIDKTDASGLTVCGTTYDGELFKLGAEGGKVFSVRVCGSKIKGLAVDSLGNFYCGSELGPQKGILYHLDQSGQEVWTVQTEGIVRAVCTDSQDIVYFSSDDHHLYSCNKNQEKLGIFNHINTVYGLVVDEHRRAYFSNKDTFYCVQFPTSSTPSWWFGK